MVNTSAFTAVEMIINRVFCWDRGSSPKMSFTHAERIRSLADLPECDRWPLDGP